MSDRATIDVTRAVADSEALASGAVPPARTRSVRFSAHPRKNDNPTPSSQAEEPSDSDTVGARQGSESPVVSRSVSVSSSRSGLKPSNSTGSLKPIRYEGPLDLHREEWIPRGFKFRVSEKDTLMEEIGEDSKHLATREADKMDSAMELDTLSRKCLENGDVFLILDLPEKSIVGHDSLAITANNTKELGFRDIPAGAHFLWVSVPNAVSRCGYWYVTPEGRKSVRVKQWDSYNEVLGAPGSQFEVREKKANLESIYPKLIPYDYNGKSGNTESGSSAPRKSLLRSASSLSLDVESLSPRHALWQYLTWEIDETTLARITGKRATNDWLVDTSDAAKGEMQFDLRFAHSGGAALKKIIGSEFSFLFSQDIADLQIVDKVSTDNDDTTPRILAHLVRVGAESHILADLQFTFLTGMHLSNLACIEHWWALVLKIILRAYRLLLTNAKLCYRLLETIHAQLVYNEKYLVSKSSEGGASRDNTAGEWMDGGEGILETIPLYKSKLRKAVQEYKRKVDEILCGSTPRRTTEHAEVADAAAELEEWFSNHVREDKRRTASTAANRQGDDDDDGVLVDRDNGSEDDDDAPVIVELDESGREVGLVSFDRD